MRGRQKDPMPYSNWVRSIWKGAVGGVMACLLVLAPVAHACHGKGDPINDVNKTPPAETGGRCADLVLFPVGSVDPSDQYRFDYSDVGFGTTHEPGATVTVTCTSNGQAAQVYAFDATRASISSGESVLARCSSVNGRSAWTVSSRVLQFVDCRLY